jgi:hypothetical protein
MAIRGRFADGNGDPGTGLREPVSPSRTKAEMLCDPAFET